MVFVDGRWREDLSIATDRLRIGSFAQRPDFGRLPDAKALYLGLPLGALVAVRLMAGREAVLLLIITIAVLHLGNNPAQVPCWYQDLYSNGF